MIMLLRENRLEDKVVPVKAEIEKLELPVKKVTIQTLSLVVYFC